MKLILLASILTLLWSCSEEPSQDPLLSHIPVQVPTDQYAYFRRLRRLSFHLRGTTPTADAFEELRLLSDEGNGAKITKFFLRKTDEYIASVEHLGKMIQRFDELFRLKSPEMLPEKQTLVPEVGRSGIETYNAFDQTVKDIVRRNLSWDHLLTSTTYNIGDSDKFFLSAILPSPPSGFMPLVSFAETDSRIGGVVTTSRFFNRYSTTSKNKSRGRASAIFRIFLCDPMMPIVVASAEADQALVDLAFSHRSTLTERAKDPHGQQASCIKCHYKLDPMGQSFLTSTTVLSQNPSSGALVYTRSDGSNANIHGGGLGDIARALTNEPDYQRCQVKHMWKWFIRGDVEPRPDRLDEMTDYFNSIDRRQNDMIKYLVNQPEFYDLHASEVSTLSVSFDEIHPILSRCDQCHKSLGFNLPKFTEFPVGGEKLHAYWLGRISSRMDLAGKGANATMPPPDSPWHPTESEINRMINWIRSGAPYQAGVPTLDSGSAVNLGRLRSP